MAMRQLEVLMWSEACAAMDRAERLHRQFFHRFGSSWQAPIDVFETEDGLVILVALPGVELDSITATLSAGILTVSGQRLLPADLQNARIERLEIPHGHFERRIELPSVPFEVSGRHLSNGCLMLRLRKQRHLAQG